MTRPFDAPTPHGMLRKLHAMRLQELHQAEVVVDFGLFPVADISYLTVEKWMASSDHDWPLLADRRAAARTRTDASRGLTDDELRRVVYDDLKRSLWRPSHAIRLAWDDEYLRLSVRWSPMATSAAEQEFATLAGIVNATPAVIVDAKPAAATAFAQALLDAQPPAPAGPVFRIDCNDLPASGVSGGRAVYVELKRVAEKVSQDLDVPSDPRVRFDDSRLTVEFDDWHALSLSGLRSSVHRLAAQRLAGSEPDHPGAPALDTRTHPMARDGRARREIERAFGQSTYSSQRKAARRAITSEFGYGSIARVYEEYDKVRGRLQLADDAVSAAGLADRTEDSFRSLFSAGGVILGENHYRPDVPQFVTENMSGLRAAGMTHLVLEGFLDAEQQDLDDFVSGRAKQMSAALLRHVRLIDRRRDAHQPSEHRAIERLLMRAREVGVRVVAADHVSARMAAGVGRISDPEHSFEYDSEKRVARYNRLAARQSQSLGPSAGVLHLTGLSHVHTTKRGYPGLAQWLGLPAAAVVVRDGKRSLEPLKEDRRRRLQAVPASSVTDHRSKRYSRIVVNGAEQAVRGIPM